MNDQAQRIQQQTSNRTTMTKLICKCQTKANTQMSDQSNNISDSASRGYWSAGLAPSSSFLSGGLATSGGYLSGGLATSGGYLSCGSATSGGYLSGGSATSAASRRFTFRRHKKRL
ncbi:predicted protein [Arabidopsis lyrata subsp. lyrata]|uniref:Predicted protein n=1 Tax=Arabidopsis lyrata subsp. lyrata TaxID=81972 RepID=D7LG50_ARALL|nr:predicted protein [Arabidopsis lyrata subsp. lyrata]